MLKISVFLRSICTAAAALDKFLLKYGISFMSNEGKIFCNAVLKDGDMVKNITAHPDVSIRSACMAFDKLSSSNIVIKVKSDNDLRSYNVYINYDIIPESLIIFNDQLVANDNSQDIKYKK